MSDDWLEQLWWTARAYAAVAALAIPTLIGLTIYLAANKKRWFPLQRLRRARWGGYEVALAFCVVNFLPLAIVATLFLMGFFSPLLGAPPEDAASPDLGVYRMRCLIVASPLILAGTLGLVFGTLYLCSQTRPRHYGLTWSRWPANLGLGLAAFLLATPIVLGLHALVTMTQAEEHVLIALTRSMQHWEWIFLAFQVVVQAPLVEEILFRGILLNWLRRASLGGHVAVGAMTGAVVLASAPAQAGTLCAWDYIGPGAFALLGAAGYAFLMRRLARRFHLNETEVQQWQLAPTNFTNHGTETATEDDVRELRRLHREADEKRRQKWAQENAWLAVYGSAMLFAAFHTPAWPAPVALMLLAVVLGWLAVRTQSLLGPITLHALFNLVSFIVLYGSTS